MGTGWNSWNYFRCDINESIVMEAADAMVASGLSQAGYVYVNLGECALPCSATPPAAAAEACVLTTLLSTLFPR